VQPWTPTVPSQALKPPRGKAIGKGTASKAQGKHGKPPPKHGSARLARLP
jgi:hypothetical protein